MLRGPKTSYKYFFLKKLKFSYSCASSGFICVSSVLLLWVSFWEPRVGWGLFHYPCPAEGAWACGDAVLPWLCCSTTVLVLRIAKLLQVYLVPPRHQEKGEWWWRLRCRKCISLLCLLHGLVSPQGHPHLPRDMVWQWLPENLPFLLLCFTL